MKKVFLTALIALASVLPVHAQSTTIEKPTRLELGWHPISYLHQKGKDLWGGSISLAMRRSDHVSYVADVAIHSTNGTSPFTMSAYRFGLRYYGPEKRKFKPFAEVLAGGGNSGTVTTTVGTTSTTAPGHAGVSFAAGGGVDRAIRPWLSWRVVQVDYSLIHAGGTNYNGVRIHTGGVFHFGH